MLKTFLPYMRPYRRYAVAAPILMSVETLLNVFIPMMMAGIIDVGIPQNDVGYILRIGGLMIAAALLAGACGSFSAAFGARAGSGLAYELRKALFARIQTYSFANLNRFSEASLITRLTTDATTLGQMAISSLGMAWRAPIMLTVALFMSFSINSELALVFALAMPLIVLVLFFGIRHAMPFWEELQRRLDRVNGRVQENLDGIRVVKTFVREDYESERFAEVNKAWMDKALQAVNVMVTLMPILNLIVAGCVMSIIWFGGNKVRAGEMLTGELLSFITYVFQIMISLFMLSFYFFQLTRAKVCAERFVEVMALESDLRSPEDALAAPADGRVAFEGVSFNYPGNKHETLSEISFSLESGETLGIIGGTGSAKTTLCQLIPRLYEVSRGRVLVGGEDVRRYALEGLRGAVAFVLQKNQLFSGTLRENLRWGNPEATDEEMREALENAEAADFVFADAQGLDRRVEQEGANFSGGQRQRLCIARALLRRPKIMILDDSTSAVDMATEGRIRASFSRRLKGMTCLVVTQRIASVMDADRILVLDGGRISGFGTHAELLAGNAIYQEVYESQNRGGISE